MPAIRDLWDRFCALRYLIVGGWNMFFGYGIFVLLYYLFGGTAIGDVVVQVVAAILGITNSFICHRYFTYRSSGVWWREYLRFYVVYGGQTLIGMGFFFFFATHLGYNGYIVEFVVTALMTIVTYWAHKFYSFSEGGFKLSRSALFFWIAFAFAVISTYYVLPSAYVHWTDDVQICEMARGGIVDKKIDWTFESYGGKELDSQSWGIYYIGGWMSEQMYQLFGEVGPRAMTVTLLFVSTLMLWWYLRRKSSNDWLTAILALLYCAYPQLPVSVQGARVDVLAFFWTILALMILQFRPPSFAKRALVFMLAGIAYALSVFSWITAAMLGPIVLFEMIENISDGGWNARNALRGLWLIIVSGMAFFAVALIIVYPFLVRWDTTKAISEVVLESNTCYATGGLLVKEFAHCMLTFPGFYAFGAVLLLFNRRTWLVAFFFAVFSFWCMQTKVYENRTIYFLFYALIGSAVVIPSIGREYLRKTLFMVVAVMLAVSFSRTYVFRNLCNYYSREARDHSRLVKIFEEQLGCGVSIYNDVYGLYFVGRELGWKQWKTLWCLPEIRKNLVAKNDYYICIEGDKGVLTSDELQTLGFSFCKNIDATVRPPDSKLGHLLFSTGRCTPLYRKYALWKKVNR